MLLAICLLLVSQQSAARQSVQVNVRGAAEVEVEFEGEIKLYDEKSVNLFTHSADLVVFRDGIVSTYDASNISSYYSASAPVPLPNSWDWQQRGALTLDLNQHVSVLFDSNRSISYRYFKILIR